MIRVTRSLLIACLATACGGDGPEPKTGSASGASSAGANDDFEACALLTAEDIRSVAGWAPDTTAAKTYGTTKTCSYTGTDAMTQSIALVVARPAPKVATSAELVERRRQAAAREPSIKMVFTPIEGLGMPAVRSEVVGAKQPTVEIVVGRHVVAVSGVEFEGSKTLAGKAAERLK